MQTASVLRAIAESLNVPESSLDLNASYLDNGGNSISLLRLQHALKSLGTCLGYKSIISMSNLTQLLHLAIQNATKSESGRSFGIKRKSSTDSNYMPERKRISKDHQSLLESAPNSARCVQINPMTDIQLSFLQTSLANPGMNIIHYHETHSPENIPALKRAWKAIIGAESILRSTYELSDMGAYLVEQHATTLDWEEIFVQDEETYKRLVEDQNLGSNFFGSTFRVITLHGNSCRSGKSRLVWRVHHALIDGYSHLLLREKLRKQVAGETCMPGLPHAQFAESLHALQTSSHNAAKAFWSRKHDEHPFSVSQLLLPIPTNTSSVREGHFPIVDLKVDAEELSARCRHLGMTLPTLYHTAWALTLAKYTNSESVFFGTVLCGRALPIPGVESVIGPTLNTLPLYIKIDRTAKLSDQMHDVFEQILELASFQWTSPKDGFTRQFHTALNVQINSDQKSRTAFDTLEPSFSTMRSAISLQIEILHNGVVRLHYDPAQYSRPHIEQVAETYGSALSMVRDASSTIKTCLSTLLTISQRHALGILGNWEASTTRRLYHRDSLVSLFTEAATQDPSAIALQRGMQTMSYSELKRQSLLVFQQISHLVSPGTVVCVHADHSVNWIVAVYAVLQAGGVYCAMDQELPAIARDDNFITCKASLFLVGLDSDKAKKPLSCKVCLSVEQLLHFTPPHLRTKDLEPRMPQLDSSAYLCFTSGSTGKAKGVLCQHRSLVAFQSDFNVRLRSRPGWKIAQFMSPAFDGSIHEIFSALSYGATLLLKDPSDPFEHLRQADAAMLTPSIAKMLDQTQFPKLKVVYLVGEAVTADVCEAWAATKTLYNMYGPTEATCGATIKQLTCGDSITLGKPNPSTRIYLLDSNQDLIPRGTIGEIYLAGVQISSGYVSRPEETIKRFLPDSIQPQWEEFMYRTGDRGYWNEDGELVFLGREDRQVKLRGFRIDMDDLEIQILRAVTDITAVAIARIEDDLVAHVQPKTLDLANLRVQIQKQVPAYAVPRHIVAVDSFPMTAVGKLNYKKMGQITGEETVPNDLKFASTTTFVGLIMAAVRGIISPCVDTQVEPSSSFLDVVGTSMLLLTLSHRLSTLLGFRIPISLLIHHPTPQTLAQSLIHMQPPTRNELDLPLGDSRVSPIEKDWWKKYQVSTDTSSFNVNFVSELECTVERTLLASAWNVVLERHRILRCNYQYSQEDDVCRVYRDQPPRARLVEALDVDDEIHGTFNLQSDPLIRVTLSPTRMVVVVSHIICDLTTLNILLCETSDVYHGRAPRSIRPYSQTKWSKSPPEPHLAFWSEYLSETSAPRYFGLRQTERSSWAGTSHILRLPKFTCQQMREFSFTQKVTMHQQALAAIALALECDGEDKCDITIGAPYLNRNSEEDQHVIGLFLEPLPIRIKYSAALEKQERLTFIRAVQKSSRAALAHAISFNHLLSHLSVTPAYPAQPLFDVVVTFHDVSQRPILSVPGTKAVDIWTRGAKFKLLAEVSELEGGDMMLRLEYSTECFDEGSVVQIGMRIERALAGLTAGKPFDALIKCVRERQG